MSNNNISNNNNSNNNNSNNVKLSNLNNYNSLYKVDLSFDMDIKGMDVDVLSDYIHKRLGGYPYYIDVTQIVDIVVDEPNDKVSVVVSNKEVEERLSELANSKISLNSVEESEENIQNDEENLKLINSMYPDKKYILEYENPEGNAELYEYNFTGFDLAKDLYHENAIIMNDKKRHFLRNDEGNPFYYDEYTNSEVSFNNRELTQSDYNIDPSNSNNVKMNLYNKLTKKNNSTASISPQPTQNNIPTNNINNTGDINNVTNNTNTTFVNSEPENEPENESESELDSELENELNNIAKNNSVKETKVINYIIIFVILVLVFILFFIIFNYFYKKYSDGNNGNKGNNNGNKGNNNGNKGNNGNKNTGNKGNNGNGNNNGKNGNNGNKGNNGNGNNNGNKGNNGNTGNTGNNGNKGNNGKGNNNGNKGNNGNGNNNGNKGNNGNRNINK